MAADGVTLKGDKEFARSYNAAMRNIERLDATKGAQMLATTIRAFAPIRTGRLRSSTVAGRRPGGGALVRVGAQYAGYVNYGTRYMRGRRFTQRALDARKDAITDQIGRDVQLELDHVRGA